MNRSTSWELQEVRGFSRIFHKGSGFTLIELIVALAVFAILSLSFFSMQLTAFSTSRLSKARDQELAIATAICERFRSEQGSPEYRSVVVYLEDSSELEPFASVSALMNSGVDTVHEDPEALRASNLLQKAFIARISCTKGEYLNLLNVQVLTYHATGGGTSLRITSEIDEV